MALIIGLSVMGALLFAIIVVCFLYCCCMRARRNATNRYPRAPYDMSQTDYARGGPEDVTFKNNSMKTRLTPHWSSDYTTSMYNYHYNVTRPNQSES
jgi:hypothetical protein